MRRWLERMLLRYARELDIVFTLISIAILLAMAWSFMP